MWKWGAKDAACTENGGDSASHGCRLGFFVTYFPNPQLHLTVGAADYTQICECVEDSLDISSLTLAFNSVNRNMEDFYQGFGVVLFLYRHDFLISSVCNHIMQLPSIVPDFENRYNYEIFCQNNRPSAENLLSLQWP